MSANYKEHCIRIYDKQRSDLDAELQLRLREKFPTLIVKDGIAYIEEESFQIARDPLALRWPGSFMSIIRNEADLGRYYLSIEKPSDKECLNFWKRFWYGR